MSQDALKALKVGFTGTRTPPDSEAFQHVFVNASGELMQSSNLAIAAGQVSGRSAVNKFGVNPDVDTTSDPEDIWGGATALWVPPTTARTHQIASTSTADDGDPAGTGAHSITITGLDANFAVQSEEIELNGTTDVPTANTYTRIYRMFITAAGSGGTNAGTITATADTDSTVTAQITIGVGQTGMAIFSVPDGKSFYLSMLATTVLGVGATTIADMRLIQTTGIDGSTAANRVRHFWSADRGAAAITFDPPKKFDGPCDVIARCQEISSSNSSVACWFDGIVA